MPNHTHARSRIAAPVAIAAFFAACSTTPKTDTQTATSRPVANKVYQRALANAFGELRDRENRSPAAADASRFLKELLVPGQPGPHMFTMTVYPKHLSMVERRADRRDQVKYLSPIKYSFSRRSVPGCHESLKLSSSEFYPETMGPKDCSRVTVKQYDPKPSKYNLGRGSFLTAQIFLDAEYRAYGVKYSVYAPEAVGPKADTRKIRWNPKEPLSSTMGIIPIDIPFYASKKLKTESGAISVPGDAPDSARQKGTLCEQGVRFEYRDTYGTPVEVGWCPGKPWPSLIVTPQFLAMLNN